MILHIFLSWHEEILKKSYRISVWWWCFRKIESRFFQWESRNWTKWGNAEIGKGISHPVLCPCVSGRGLRKQGHTIPPPLPLFLLFNRSVVSKSLQSHWNQHSSLPYPSLCPGVCSNSCPSSQWCHPTISSSVVCFSSFLQSFPASGSFPVSQFFTSGGQSIGASASASVLPMNIQDWFPLGWTSWISL